MAALLQTNTLYLTIDDVKEKYKRTIETVSDKVLLLKCLNQSVKGQVINADIVFIKEIKKILY